MSRILAVVLVLVLACELGWLAVHQAVAQPAPITICPPCPPCAEPSAEVKTAIEEAKAAIQQARQAPGPTAD